MEENAAAYRLTRSGLQGALLRYEPVAPLVADRDDVIAFLKSGKSRSLGKILNQQLSSLATEIEASDIYVMDKSGQTVATSNFDLPRSFLDKNFRYRPYFTEAIAGRAATYFALGISSGKRGFYYSSPVHHDGKVIGVVVVKITVDAIEASWKNNNHDVFVADQHGIIFMASRDEWRFKSIDPLSHFALTQIEIS
ncbi:MAG: cache domain-containing protein, partial [Hyphomicrobiales bacterium]